MTNQSATFDQVPRSLMNPTAGRTGHCTTRLPSRTCSGLATTSKAPRSCSTTPASRIPMAMAGANTTARSSAMSRPAPMAGPTGRLRLKWLLPPERRSASTSRPTTLNGPSIRPSSPSRIRRCPTGYDIFMMWSDGAGPTQPWGRIRQLLSSEFVGMASNWNGNWGQY